MSVDKGSKFTVGVVDTADELPPVSFTSVVLLSGNRSGSPAGIIIEKNPLARRTRDKILLVHPFNTYSTIKAAYMKFNH